MLNKTVEKSRNQEKFIQLLKDILAKDIKVAKLTPLVKNI